MNLRSLFHLNTLAPAWAFAPGGIIWRILFSEEGTIIGEARNQDAKTASFFCLDERTGKLLWAGLTLEEPWWVGIEAVHKGIVILHLYAKPDMPEHRGIQAVDAHTGALRWRNDDVTYWFCASGFVYAYRDFFDRRVGYEIELSSGNIRRTFDGSPEELHAIRQQAIGEQGDGALLLPEPFIADGADPTIARVVRNATTGHSLVGSVELLHLPDFLLFNYHVSFKGEAPEHPVLENRFFVHRLPGGNRVYSEILGRNLKAYVPDTFFLKKPLLYYIKDQQALTAVNLWKS